MATFDENIRKIRSEAIYGDDMREAIAQGLEQSTTVIDGKITQYETEVTNVVSGYTQRLDTIERDIEAHDLFISAELIQDDDYKAIIVGSVG